MAPPQAQAPEEPPLETDDSAEAFKKALHRVATAKPKESKEKSSDRGR